MKWLLGAVVGLICGSAVATEVTGLVQANLVLADSQDSFFNGGTGILRWDENQPNLQQAFIRVSHPLSSSLTADVIVNGYEDGGKHLGLSQAQLLYKPLSSGSVKWRGRAGMFYPRFSLENVEEGWLSPYTYTQSAINSWFGEELRAIGMEVTAYSPGRARRSPWSWELHGAIYKGNDPLGSIITWRGFALHDRQSLHNDRVQFAPYPSVLSEEVINGPDFVDPFREIDGRFGYYVGAHLDYYRQTSFRYYYYDNNADPLELNDLRLYAWHTRFHSLAVQHKIDKTSRIISQFLVGNTVMGDQFVSADFESWYVMYSKAWQKHRFSLRYDRFIVDEYDAIPQDRNDSDGAAFTTAWRYDIDDNWQVGLEFHYNTNEAQSRIGLEQPPQSRQTQTLAVLQYRIR